jgi:isochorismate synthase
MNIDSDIITLFAGGGITDKSDSEKEWEETELKINTLKTLL